MIDSEREASYYRIISERERLAGLQEAAHGVSEEFRRQLNHACFEISRVLSEEVKEIIGSDLGNLEIKIKGRPLPNSFYKLRWGMGLVGADITDWRYEVSTAGIIRLVYNTSENPEIDKSWPIESPDYLKDGLEITGVINRYLKGDSRLRLEKIERKKNRWRLVEQEVASVA